MWFQARNVPYVNVEEEEWERFQKEIGEEMSTAQSILVEDREEVSTTFLYFLLHCLMLQICVEIFFTIDEYLILGDS